MIVNSTRELAAEVGVNVRNIFLWINRDMPRKRVGDRKYEYDVEEIIEWRGKLEAVEESKKLPVIPVDPTNALKMKAKIEEFKVNKADILAAAQMSSLDLQNRVKKLKLADLDDEDIKKLTNAEATRWFQILGVDFAIKYDKEALERNKGVDNVNKILDVIYKLKELDGQKRSDI